MNLSILYALAAAALFGARGIEAGEVVLITGDRYVTSRLFHHHTITSALLGLVQQLVGPLKHR